MSGKSKHWWGQLSNDYFTTAVEDLIRRHGDVGGVVQRMEEMGIGSVARSWIDSNLYEPIFSEQLHTLFGTAVLRAFAAKVDLHPRDLVRRLSQALPRVIHRRATARA